MLFTLSDVSDEGGSMPDCRRRLPDYWGAKGLQLVLSEAEGLPAAHCPLVSQQEII
jgi:hypothetical protein